MSLTTRSILRYKINGYKKKERLARENSIVTYEIYEIFISN